mmetsp:Transcript_13840/g.35585  ORF Transcript_13840/g.35585 Transcript_13840/m.35585 type:complete len:515 (+) Transcript_13840:203-1747(+)
MARRLNETLFYTQSEMKKRDAVREMIGEVPTGHRGTSPRQSGAFFAFFSLWTAVHMRHSRGLGEAVSGALGEWPPRNHGLRKSHLAVVAIGAIGGRDNTDRHAVHARWWLEPVLLRPPHARRGRDVPRLVKLRLVGDVAAGATVHGRGAAQELASVVVERFDKQASRCVAMVVQCNEVGLWLGVRNGHPRSCDGVVALGCRGVAVALRYVVLVVVSAGADSPIEAHDLGVLWLVLLEVDPELLVVPQRPVLPRHLLLGVEQQPRVMAGGKPAHVRPQIARRVALGQQVAPGLRRAAVTAKAHRLAGGKVLDLPSPLPKRVGGGAADADGTACRPQPDRVGPVRRGVVRAESGPLSDGRDDVDDEVCGAEREVVCRGTHHTAGEHHSALAVGDRRGDHMDGVLQHRPGEVVAKLSLRHGACSIDDHGVRVISHELCPKPDAKPHGGRPGERHRHEARRPGNVESQNDGAAERARSARDVRGRPHITARGRVGVGVKCGRGRHGCGCGGAAASCNK